MKYKILEKYKKFIVFYNVEGCENKYAPPFDHVELETDTPMAIGENLIDELKEKLSDFIYDYYGSFHVNHITGITPVE